jgi:membrane protein
VRNEDPAPPVTGPMHLSRAWRFGKRVVKHFSNNKGILLAGGVALNTLLSIIPLTVVVTALLSHFFDEQTVIAVISRELEILIPGDTSALRKEITNFNQYRGVFGWSGAVVLIFQSSLAFRTMKEAMGVIFHRVAKPRPLWKTLVIPFVYIAFFVLLICSMTMLGLLVNNFVQDAIAGLGLYLLAVLGHAVLFTGYYLVMPTAKVGLKRAVIGGTLAAILWEIVRTTLTWYFSKVSLVGVIYGSLATSIVVLLGMELIAIILLLGAQVIVELLDSDEKGLRWYEPDELPKAEKA